jgi:hypothetical protein
MLASQTGARLGVVEYVFFLLFLIGRKQSLLQQVTQRFVQTPWP